MSGRISFFRETLRNGALDYRIESGTALLRVPGRADQSRKNIGQGPKNTNGWLIYCLLSPPKVLCWKWRENAAPWLSRQSATDRRPPQLAASSLGSIICKIPSCFSSIGWAFWVLKINRSLNVWGKVPSVPFWTDRIWGKGRCYELCPPFFSFVLKPISGCRPASRQMCRTFRLFGRKRSKSNARTAARCTKFRCARRTSTALSLMPLIGSPRDLSRYGEQVSSPALWWAVAPWHVTGRTSTDAGRKSA